MVKRSLQTKIIFIFVLMVLTILVSMGIFSYIKMEIIYENMLYMDMNNSYIEYIDRTKREGGPHTNIFRETFSLYDDGIDGIILDNNFNIVSEEQEEEKIIVDDQLKELIAKSSNVQLQKYNNNYVFIKEMLDTNNNTMYYLVVEQSADFINNQLNEYVKIVILFVLVLIAIALIVSIAISRNIINPIKKLSRNLEDVISGNIEGLDEIPTYGGQNEVNDLVTKFKILNSKLSDNLKEISSQKAQIETILMHMSDGVMAFDVYGNLIYQNPAALRLLNINVSHKRFDDIFKKINIDVNLEKIIFLQDLTSSEKTLNIGDTFVNMYFEPFKNEEDIIGGVIVLIQDITKQVKLDDMRKEFVANVSHELKTPITTITGYAEALTDNQLDNETQHRFVSVIANEAQRMARLVTDLLQLSRFDTNKTENKKIEFDLGELTKKAYEKLLIEAQNRGHEMECYVTADVPKIYADKDGIEQVILNIISNSIKYTPDYGSIKIYVGFVYNHAYVKVIDNGIGIPAKDISRVFERFYRVDKARSREQGGTGLGLAIAKEIVERNNGNIDITSDIGKGTEVVIRLPVEPKDKRKNK